MESKESKYKIFGKYLGKNIVINSEAVYKVNGPPYKNYKICSLFKAIHYHGKFYFKNGKKINEDICFEKINEE